MEKPSLSSPSSWVGDEFSGDGRSYLLDTLAVLASTTNDFVIEVDSLMADFMSMCRGLDQFDHWDHNRSMGCYLLGDRQDRCWQAERGHEAEADSTARVWVSTERCCSMAPEIIIRQPEDAGWTLHTVCRGCSGLLS